MKTLLVGTFVGMTLLGFVSVSNAATTFAIDDTFVGIDQIYGFQIDVSDGLLADSNMKLYYNLKGTFGGAVAVTGNSVPGQDNSELRTVLPTLSDSTDWDFSVISGSTLLAYTLGDAPLEPGKILTVDANLGSNDILFWEMSDSTGDKDHFIFSNYSGDKDIFDDVVYLNFDGSNTFTFSLKASSTGDSGSPVPIPAAAWLLGSGLVGLLGLRRKRA